VRINAIVEDSIVDGPGLRYVVFVQGCPHGCPGCHNPQTHDPDGGYEESAGRVVENFRRSLAENPLIGGVTISGGEPFVQARELLPFAEAVRAAGLNLWVYTGYTIEEIAERGDPDEISLLSRADALVDGRFVLGLRTLESNFVGSSNQRIIESPGDQFP
jgi:anaerobic ribonucleoside-triphosphate reductase activating protein